MIDDIRSDFGFPITHAVSWHDEQSNVWNTEGIVKGRIELARMSKDGIPRFPDSPQPTKLERAKAYAAEVCARKFPVKRLEQGENE